MLSADGDMEDKVWALEETMLNMPQIEIPIEHTIHGGIYVRKGVIPAGVAVTGEVYKNDHIVFVVSGDHSFTTDSGVKRVQGPCIFTAKAGAKRAGYSHTDTVWMTIHKTDKTTIEEIEDELWFTTDEKFDRWLEKWSE